MPNVVNGLKFENVNMEWGSKSNLRTNIKFPDSISKFAVSSIRRWILSFFLFLSRFRSCQKLFKLDQVINFRCRACLTWYRAVAVSFGQKNLTTRKNRAFSSVPITYFVKFKNTRSHLFFPFALSAWWRYPFNKSLLESENLSKNGHFCPSGQIWPSWTCVSQTQL